MNKNINELIDFINEAFFGVTLDDGISWSEAKIMEDYGTAEERKLARLSDEKQNWDQIPDHIIGDLKFQDVLPFLDPMGLKYYLPCCMIYSLKNYANSHSLIVSSTIWTLTRKAVVTELKPLLSSKQKLCIINFLYACLEIGDDYLDLHKTEARLHKYWIESSSNDDI